jgi:hypothetical protein
MPDAEPCLCNACVDIWLHRLLQLLLLLLLLCC